ncbi:MAG: hypothetical protein HRU33_08675 [Rhodobacteraceae bacterium]|nr:hypothetical protein [Paracoccaceae bacterium]
MPQNHCAPQTGSAGTKGISLDNRFEKKAFWRKFEAQGYPMYKRLSAILCVFAIFSMSACTGVSVRNAARSQSQAYKAQGAVAEQRLEFVKNYQDCIAKAGENLQQVEACDVYLKSAEALS